MQVSILPPGTVQFFSSQNLYEAYSNENTAEYFCTQFQALPYMFSDHVCNSLKENSCPSYVQFVVKVIAILAGPHKNDVYQMGRCPIVRQHKGVSLGDLNKASIPTGNALLIDTNATLSELRKIQSDWTKLNLKPSRSILKQPLSNGARTTSKFIDPKNLADRFVKYRIKSVKESKEGKFCIPHLVLQQRAPQATEVFAVCSCVLMCAHVCSCVFFFNFSFALLPSSDRKG
jgi:hypothetical protein